MGFSFQDNIFFWKIKNKMKDSDANDKDFWDPAKNANVPKNYIYKMDGIDGVTLAAVHYLMLKMTKT